MYCRAQRLSKAREVVQQMKDNGITPDYEVYRLLLGLCRKKREEVVGLEILNEARSMGVKVKEADEKLFDPEVYRLWYRNVHGIRTDAPNSNSSNTASTSNNNSSNNSSNNNGIPVLSGRDQAMLTAARKRRPEKQYRAATNRV